MRPHSINYANDTNIYQGRKSEVLATVDFFFFSFAQVMEI